jgi:hypothetical protein
LPNADFAPCCDHRIPTSYAAYEDDFLKKYNSLLFRDEVNSVTSKCGGCMYGSYPEMSIAMRFMAAKLQRTKTFVTSPPPKKWPFSYEELLGIAETIARQDRHRPPSRASS